MEEETAHRLAAGGSTILIRQRSGRKVRRSSKAVSHPVVPLNFRLDSSPEGQLMGIAREWERGLRDDFCSRIEL